MGPEAFGLPRKSVRAWIVLLVGNDVDDTLILQVKEAKP
jgi:hypothetical protein